MVPRSTESVTPRSATVSRRRSQPERNVLVTSRASMASEGAETGGMRSDGTMRRMADPGDEVVEANARFYRAFEALDVSAMDEAWAHGEHVKCVHPGWPLLTGWDAVRESWARIFENTEEMRFTHLRCPGGGERRCRLGHLHREHPLRGPGPPVGHQDPGHQPLRAQADGWRMVHHHGSHILAPQ